MLTETFQSISQKMQIDFLETTRRITHSGEKGNARENLLVDYLRAYIPDKYAFAKGIIIDSFDSQSKQVDIIIHDRLATPYLLDMDSTKIIPIESVYGVIEVKSKLTKEELQKSVENIKSVRSLSKRTSTGLSFPTAGFVFAYDSDSSMETIYRNFIEISKDVDKNKLINCICVLNKGLIVPVEKAGLSTITLFPNENTIYAIHKSDSNALLHFYLLLFQILNSLTVFPPDIFAYANSSGKLDTELFVPTDALPEDATVRVMNRMMSIADIKTLREYGQRMLSGKLKKEEILECAFGIYIPSLKQMHGTLDTVPSNSVLDFFGTEIQNRYLIQMYRLYEKGSSITDAEAQELNDFEAELFKLYDKNRDAMLRAAKNT